MPQYQNVPMDLADAALVVASEVLGITSILTLDSDFRIYRPGGSGVLEALP